MKFKKCSMCDGKGKIHIDGKLKDCLVCKGKGQIKIRYVTCQECGIEVDREYTTIVKDRYGIPYKRTCFDCREKVQKRILKFEYDYLNAGEYLDDC